MKLKQGLAGLVLAAAVAAGVSGCKEKPKEIEATVADYIKRDPDLIVEQVRSGSEQSFNSDKVSFEVNRLSYGKNTRETYECIIQITKPDGRNIYLLDSSGSDKLLDSVIVDITSVYNPEKCTPFLGKPLDKVEKYDISTPSGKIVLAEAQEIFNTLLKHCSIEYSHKSIGPDDDPKNQYRLVGLGFGNLDDGNRFNFFAREVTYPDKLIEVETSISIFKPDGQAIHYLDLIGSDYILDMVVFDSNSKSDTSKIENYDNTTPKGKKVLAEGQKQFNKYIEESQTQDRWQRRSITQIALESMGIDSNWERIDRKMFPGLYPTSQ
jgi:hypothetical protein